MLDAMAKAERTPDVLRRLERVERVAVGAVADRVHGDGEVRLRPEPDQLLELLARRDAHARAVEQQRGLRAERPVHERLQRAEPEEGAPEAPAQTELHDLARVLMGYPLPHTQRQPVVRVQLLEERQSADPAVFVRDRGVDRSHSTRRGELQPFAHGSHRLALAVRRLHELLAEEPRRLLAQDARRLAALVDLHDAAFHAQVAVRVRKRRGVQPHRVTVARGESGRDVAGDRVEDLPRRLDRRRPVSAPPAASPQPASVWDRADGPAHALDRLLQRPGSLEAHLVLGESPRDEVHVRVGEAGQHAAAAEIDGFRRRERGLVRADSAGDPVARDRECARGRQRVIERADDAVFEDHGGGESNRADVPRLLIV